MRGDDSVSGRVTDSEIEFIKQNYKSMTDAEIADKLGRGVSTIKKKRREFVGLKAKSRVSVLWSDNEVEILERYYPYETWDVILQKLPNRKKGSIISKAYKMKIKRDCHFWNEEELGLAIKMYNNGCSYAEMNKALNYKFTESSIATKLFNIGTMKSNKWTEKELSILLKNYESDCKYVYQQIDRKPRQIQEKARSLGLKHPLTWMKYEDNYIKENYKTMKDYEMADVLDRTGRAVKWRRNKLGLKSYFYSHFGNSCIAKDGTVCLSYAEMCIHNYLVSKNLDIKKEVYYKDVILSDKTERRFDWSIVDDSQNNTWYIEYFGMYSPNRKNSKAISAYNLRTKKKIKDLYKAGIIDKCMFIFPNDLKNKTLDEIFGEYVNVGNMEEIKAS